MIKKLLIVYLFTVSSVMAGLPPTTIKNQNAASKTVNFNLELPNNQSVPTAASTALITTGNKDELQNSNFEHSTVTTGWTVSNATASGNTANPLEGKKSLSLALTGALSLSQSSTINAAQKSGVQMVASIWVNSSDVSDLQLCSLKNGAEDKCTVKGGYVQGSGWRQLTVSFLGNSTSNGLKLKSTDTTGTVLVDQAYVGIGSPVVDFTPDNVYSAKISSTGVVSDENTDFIQGDCTLSGTANNRKTCTFKTSEFTVSPNCVVVANSPTCESGGCGEYQTPVSVSASQIILAGLKNSDTAYSVSSLQLICQKQGADYKTSKAYVASSSDYGWTSFTPTSPNSSLTISSPNCYHKKEGQDLLIDCKFTGSGQQASEMRIALPASLSTSTTQYSTTKVCGKWTRAESGSSTNKSSSVICQSGVSYLNFSIEEYTPTSNPFTALNANAIFSTSQDFHILARVTIQGWTDSGVIVGSFEGIEKCANDYECADGYSAIVNEFGAILWESLPWIASTSSAATGRRQLTYKSILKDGVNPLTNPMSCNITIDGVQVGGGDYSATVRTNTNSLIDIDFKHIAVGGINAKFYIRCSKLGSDYKPKTAKVASSIGVPTVPGIVGISTGERIDKFTVSYGATATSNCTATPCPYIDAIGTGFSVGNSGSTYTLTTPKTYTKLKCSISGWNGTVAAVTGIINGTNSNTFTFTTLAGAGSLVQSYGNIDCTGSY